MKLETYGDQGAELLVRSIDKKQDRQVMLDENGTI